MTMENWNPSYSSTHTSPDWGPSSSILPPEYYQEIPPSTTTVGVGVGSSQSQGTGSTSESESAYVYPDQYQHQHPYHQFTTDTSFWADTTLSDSLAYTVPGPGSWEYQHQYQYQYHAPFTIPVPGSTSITAQSTTPKPESIPNTPLQSIPPESEPSLPPPPPLPPKIHIPPYAHPLPNGLYRCAHPTCTSQTTFRRICDLRKHYNRHQKLFFCRYEGCPAAVESGGGGFSSKKDRARHEAGHNPGIRCETSARTGCTRVFSRVDNMRDHVRRIHLRGR